MRVEMQIKNLFRLSDGQTALVGTFKQHIDKRVVSSDCELQHNGSTHQRIKSIFEMMPKKIVPNDLRSIGTFEQVDLSAEDAQTGEWKLVIDVSEV